MRQWLACLFVMQLSAAAFAAPVSLPLQRAGSTVSFTAHTKLFDVTGTFQQWRGTLVLDRENLTASKVTVEVDVDTLDTGINARDEHVRGEDFLHTATHKKATFVSREVQVGGPAGIVVVGDLTIRGVTKRVSVPIELADLNGKVHATGKLQLNRFDYGVNYKASLLTPAVAPEVELTFVFQFAPGA
ncbi:MAG: YceI family protein [Myxococcota bacterium]